SANKPVRICCINFLVSPLIIEPINVLRVTLRESKCHEGAYEANDPGYDNSGLSDVVNDWGLRTNVGIHRHYIRNIKERNPQVYMIKRKTVNGWGIERVVLGEVRPIVMRNRTPVSWLCLSRLSRTRMASPSGGRGRPLTFGDGHEPDYGQREFFAAMTHMANTIQEGMAAANAAHANVAAGGESDGPVDARPMTLANFLKINPPTFQETSNPSKADDWFLSVERA
ncbi:hypothetical protein PIB30_104989, partial [Stylosanthes scabra]|nr:hypothetical protein [Stylosanthes scabra]